MRSTQYMLATVRQVPSDVEIVSHRLMLRAGMIRQLASGIYNWLPTGLRVLKKVENIVREEMNRAGAQEVLMPSVQPAEIWRQSGRWDVFGPELLRFKDRHERDFCLGPDHEEVITTLINNEIHKLSSTTGKFLSDAMEVSRRDSTSVWRYAVSRILDERCLLIRFIP